MHTHRGAAWTCVPAEASSARREKVEPGGLLVAVHFFLSFLYSGLRLKAESSPSPSVTCSTLSPTPSAGSSPLPATSETPLAPAAAAADSVSAATPRTSLSMRSWRTVGEVQRDKNTLRYTNFDQGCITRTGYRTDNIRWCGNFSPVAT